MLNNLQFDIDYSNHPISKFIIKDNIYHSNCESNYEIDYNNVFYYFPDNLDKTRLKFYINFILYLNSINDSTYFMFSNNVPFIEITNFQRMIIQKKFLPSIELQSCIDQTKQQLGLIDKEYSVLHIRTGDRFIKNNEKLDTELINSVNQLISHHINVTEKYLILSDNNDIKVYLKNKYKQFIVFIQEITHLSIENTNDDSIKNTLVDFFLMQYSNKINAFSPYGHKTGFSEYCAKIFNIPYNCYTIHIKTEY
jgi:hypothetical protein